MRITNIIVLAIFCSLFITKSFGQTKPRVIHVFVALCDNENQGIVPVSASLGNGQDPNNNLYWSAAYGVKTYFEDRSKNWILLDDIDNPSTKILERIIFKNTESNTYLVADAYDGAYIKQSTIDFLHATSGQRKDTLECDSIQLYIGGNADLLAYVGHNGLMDFELDEKYKVNMNRTRDVIILACYSKAYFEPYMKKFNVNPLVWSNGLMSPEAYTLKWAIDGWLKGETNEQIVDRARNAYNHYQKCGMRGATNLLSTGF